MVIASDQLLHFYVTILGKLFTHTHTRVSLSPSSVIWYWPKGKYISK